MSDVHPDPRVPSSVETEDHFPRSTGVLLVSRDSVGTLWVREGACAPREPPGESELWLQMLLVRPGSPAMGPGPARRGPGLLQVNAFCR